MISPLGMNPDVSSVTPLIAALSDLDKFVRENAVYALGEIRDSRAVDPLKAALEDADVAVQKAAAEALNKLGCNFDH